MLCQRLTVPFNICISAGRIIQIQCAKIQGQELFGCSGKTELINIAFAVCNIRCRILENIQAISSCHISEALEQAAQDLTNEQILNDTSYIQIVIVHIEAVDHIIGQGFGVAVPCHQLVKEGGNIACICKSDLISIRRLGSSVQVHQVNQLTVYITQRKSCTVKLHNQVIGQVLDVDDNCVHVRIHLIDLFHDDVVVGACADSCIGENIGHQLQLVLQVLLGAGHVLF